jgi:hypothetical protein
MELTLHLHFKKQLFAGSSHDKTVIYWLACGPWVDFGNLAVDPWLFGYAKLFPIN